MNVWDDPTLLPPETAAATMRYAYRFATDMDRRYRRKTMPRNRSLFSTLLTLFLLTFAFCVASEAATPSSKPKPKSKPSARLIVQRAPNFGTNLVVQLWIDGKKTANIPRDQHYGGLIPAGRHGLTVFSLPNTQSRRPTTVRLWFQSGKVYLYTAIWERDRVVLRPSTFYVHTQAVKPIHGR